MTQNTLETPQKHNPIDAPSENQEAASDASKGLSAEAEQLTREKALTPKENGEKSLPAGASLECTNCYPESAYVQRGTEGLNNAENAATKRGDATLPGRLQSSEDKHNNKLQKSGADSNFDRLKVGDQKAQGDSFKDGGDRGSELTKAGVIADYASTLRRAGMSEAEANRISESTYARMKKDAAENHLKGSPEAQMTRANEAHNEILDKIGVRSDGRLEDGQKDYLNQKDRQNIVKDSAARLENPDKFVNQGEHMTCALESLNKQQLEAGDPALAAERLASVVNRGYATIKEDGENGKERKVHVASMSFMPDAESRKDFDPAYHGDAGKRGMAGHVWDSLAGQTAADLKAEREHLPTSAEGINQAKYVYMAAHSSAIGGRASQTSTNEGLFERGKNGSLSLIADSPNVSLWDVVHLNKAMGGKDGAVFASTSLLQNGDKPPAGYPSDLIITAFNGPQDLHSKLTAYEKRTGQSGQLGVNAPFLPGGGENGHGMHAMNIRANKDGKTFKLDNNWGSSQDLSAVDFDKVDKATNANRWGGGTVPNDGTVFGPGSGRNPNESVEDFAKRKEEESKLKEDEKLKKERDEEQEREAKRQKEALEKKAEQDLKEAKRLEKEISDLRKSEKDKEKETAQRISEMVLKKKDARQAEQLAMGLGHTSRWNHNS